MKELFSPKYYLEKFPEMAEIAIGAQIRNNCIKLVRENRKHGETWAAAWDRWMPVVERSWADPSRFAPIIADKIRAAIHELNK